ncbi:MAG: twin-arginine translocation signal domain-containing protein [Vicinamibacterales bacterium]
MDRRQFLKASAVGALVTAGPTGAGSFGVAVVAQTAAGGGADVRIPIHMSHGVDRVPTPTSANGRKTLTAEGMDALYRIARDMGFESIGYDDLERWRAGLGALPRRPVMIDFDHPTITMR